MIHELKKKKHDIVNSPNTFTEKLDGHWATEHVLFSHMQLTGKEVPHNPSWPLPLQLYVVAHFLLVIQMYHNLFEDKAVRIALTWTLTLSKGKIFNVSRVFF